MVDQEVKKKFKGFKSLKFPVFVSIMPQSGFTFNVRLLTVSEVRVIRESLVTRNKITDVINSILWQAIVDKPEEIKTFDDFLKYTTIKDRDALIYSVYTATYGFQKIFNVVCGKCGTSQTQKFNLNKMFHMNFYPSETYNNSIRLLNLKENDENIIKYISSNDITKGNSLNVPSISTKAKVIVPSEDMPEGMARDEEIYKTYFELLDAGTINKDGSYKILENESNTEEIMEDIFTKRIRVPLPNNKNIIVYIKQPTLENEHSVFKDLSLLPEEILDLAQDSLIIDKIEEYTDSDCTQLLQTIVDRVEIIEAVQDLPPLDVEEFVKVAKKNFSKYGIELKGNWNCQSCAKSNELVLDLVDNFFRAILGSNFEGEEGN